MSAINRVILLGNLTRDPETRQAGATTVCTLRLAVNDRVKNKDTGTWGDCANFFTVKVFGAQGERCAQYLAKGHQAAIDGRLRWRSRETQDGSKHEAVEVVADNVQFVGARDDGGTRPPAPMSTKPAESSPADDIPF